MDARSSPTLTVSYLVRAAQAYLARRAASRLQLAQVLLRKARRAAGEDQETDAEAVRTLVEAAVERVALAGWINDGMLAQARAASLARSGLPASAVRRRLVHQGFGREMPDDQLLAIDDESQARRYAERKRLGPFASGRRSATPRRRSRRRAESWRP